MVNAAFKELEAASEQYVAALMKFKKTFNPENVGIDEFMDYIADVLFEINEEIASTEEE